MNDGRWTGVVMGVTDDGYVGRVDVVADESLTDVTEDALAAADEYEQTIDDVYAGYAVCSGDDCRSPRVGPFVVDLNGDNARIYCRLCYCADVLRIDPDDVGLI